MMTDDDTRFGPQDTQPGAQAETASTGQDAGRGADHPTSRLDHPAPGQGHDHGAHEGHLWMMMACCVPMLVIAIALVVSGTAGAGVVIVAIGCTLMMAMMMRGMGGHGHGRGDRA